MNCPRCNAPAEEATLREFGGVCPKCLLAFSEEKDAPAFPNLEILEMLGQGGMGVVYKARQKNLDRIVALKVLSPHLSEDPEFVERFTREAKALAQLTHPHIVGIHDSGIHDRVPYLVMEYVDGTPLRTLLASAKLTPDRALMIIPQICDALNYAHAKGVVHRDIKPENILIDREDKVKIADFGLAKLGSVEESRLTKTGSVMGSPHYMAPEQVQNSGRVDHRADIYSLGVVFYEMLTGELPLGRFKPPSEKSTADRRLDPVVLKSLEREPADRWQSAEEMKKRVLRLEEGTKDTIKPEKKTEILVGLSCALIGMALAAALSQALRLDTIYNGPLTIAMMGICLLVGLTLLYRGRAISGEDSRRIRRQLVGVAIGAGIVILFSIALLLTIQKHPAPAQPPSAAVDRRVPGSTAFHLVDAWPRPEELPAGLPYDSVLEGADAFPVVPKRTENPDGSVTIRQGAQYRDMLPDLVIGRMATLAHGGVRLIGLEFKTEYARKRWQRECQLYPLPLPNWNEPQGKSIFILGKTSLGEVPTSSAAFDLLRPLIQKKMKEAAAVYRE